MKRNKQLLISSIAINNIGDLIFDLFIAWELSSATGKFMNAVYIIGTSVAFRAMLCFLIGAFVDRHSKKKIMVLSHLSSIIIIATFSFLWEMIHQSIIIGILLVLLNDVNNELFTRSYVSMTSDMFDENQYIQFQSHANIVTRMIGIGGAALVGTFIQYVSSSTVFTIDIITYILSFLLILQVKYEEPAIQHSSSTNLLKTMISDVQYTWMTIIRSSYLLSFIILMFILNIAYGYIPHILPIFKANLAHSATLLGLLKSSITIGEIVGFVFVSKISRYVSRSFKLSMFLNIFVIGTIYFTQNPYFLVALFTIYGFSDSLTQPLFGYTISNLDTVNRGKLLGGIDAIIMFSPSIGIYVISAISTYNKTIGAIVLSTIFIIGLLIVSFHKDMKNIILDNKT